MAGVDSATEIKRANCFAVLQKESVSARFFTVPAQKQMGNCQNKSELLKRMPVHVFQAHAPFEIRKGLSKNIILFDAFAQALTWHFPSARE